MSILDLFRSKERPDLDQSVLVQLRKAGSDLSKPHNSSSYISQRSQLPRGLRPPSETLDSRLK